MKRATRQRAQSVLYAVLLMPLLLMVLALAIDIGELQLEKLRLHYALDLATLSGTGGVDTASYSRTGRLTLDPGLATELTSEYLRQNLSRLADTPDPAAILAGGEIRVVNQVPAQDPFSGAALNHPAVCARIHFRHRFALLGLAGLDSVDVTVSADSEIKP